jgi:hypothetical protein
LNKAKEVILKVTVVVFRFGMLQALWRIYNLYLIEEEIRRLLNFSSQYDFKPAQVKPVDTFGQLIYLRSIDSPRKTGRGKPQIRMLVF